MVMSLLLREPRIASASLCVDVDVYIVEFAVAVCERRVVALPEQQCGSTGL